MIGVERSQRDVQKSLTDGATATAPHIVNGLTVRPREQINPGLYDFFCCRISRRSSFSSVSVTHRLLRYLGTTGKKED
jgi:hypothetical protein